MFDQAANKSRSAAGPTPYHRQSSFFPIGKKQKFQWLLYDNQGSFNGWFDWLPLWMRVGSWSKLFIAAVVLFYTSLIWFKPSPLEFEPSSITSYDSDTSYWMGIPKATVIDLAIFMWGLVVIAHAKISMQSVMAFFISFTGWSWMLITLRSGLEFGAWMTYERNNYLSLKLATLGSSLRLVTITNATVVCSIWNLVLFPIMYFISLPPGEKRTNFLKFNFGFFMVNIHILNLPLAWLNILSGDRVRPFTQSDLWVSYVVIMMYSMVYFFIMDRLGMHFYPILCPRSKLSLISIGLVIWLYYYLYTKWNEHIQSA
jgi:hypothetical protein